MTGWMSDMTGPQACRQLPMSQRRRTWPVWVNQPERAGPVLSAIAVVLFAVMVRVLLTLAAHFATSL